MGRAFGFLLALLIIGGVAFGLSRVPEALAHMELFRVSDVALEGARYLSEEDAIATVAIPNGASVWDDLEPFAARLRTHPLVREAKVGRKLPGTLVLRIVEREPVALLPTPALVPVDGQGNLLPIDPALNRLDLPLIQPFRAGASASELTPAQLRAVAEEVGRLTGAEPHFMTRVSEVAYDPGGVFRVRLSQPDVQVHFHAPLSPRRLLEGLAALSDAVERRPDTVVRAIDLRYADQVVIRFSPDGRT